MLYNIYQFTRFAGFVKSQKTWKNNNFILYLPIVLLILFFAGYLVVGFFGRPDVVVAGILFGGSLFVYVMYMMLDIITQKIIEGEHLQAELMAAEESNRIKVSFLSSISHEMRTPMNVILGLDRKALGTPDLQPELREELEKIGQCGRLLLGMINNILDINRIDTGETITRNERYSLRDALSQIGTLVNTQCEEKGLTFQMSVGDDVPDECMGDAMRLKQVLVSILDNAIKYTDSPGTVTFRTECLSRGEEDCLQQFTVTDTGIGIDPDFLPRIFDVFAQEDASSTSRYGGSGLSLALTKKVLDAMGGTIAITSEKNTGTTVVVTVPVTAAAGAGAPEAEEEEVSLEGRRILVVDDIAENSEITADLLELEGAESEIAENGQIALDMLKQSPEWYYDAVLMDLRMPVMDGLEAARRIRAQEREDLRTIPVIALSANDLPVDIRQSLEAGMNEHLAKPVDADRLYAVLKQFIRR